MQFKAYSIILSAIVSITPVLAQTADPMAKTYKVESTTSGQRQITGYVPTKGADDKTAFANAMLWTVNNVCQQFLDKITSADLSGNSLQCDMDFNSLDNSEKKNTYHCKLTLRVAEGRLLYTLSDVTIESKIVVLKKQNSLDRLEPEKKNAHKELISDFEQAATYWLNSLFDFVGNNKPATVSHWESITQHNVVKGMTEDEVLLALGKPLMISGNSGNGEIQWKYGSSYFVFLKDRKVVSVLK